MVTLAMSFTSCYPRLGEISRIGVQLGYLRNEKSTAIQMQLPSSQRL